MVARSSLSKPLAASETSKLLARTQQPEAGNATGNASRKANKQQKDHQTTGQRIEAVQVKGKQQQQKSFCKEDEKIDGQSEEEEEEEEEEDQEYADDFEDYESDFEEDVDEEWTEEQGNWQDVQVEQRNDEKGTSGDHLLRDSQGPTSHEWTNVQGKSSTREKEGHKSSFNTNSTTKTHHEATSKDKLDDTEVNCSSNIHEQMSSESTTAGVFPADQVNKEQVKKQSHPHGKINRATTGDSIEWTDNEEANKSSSSTPDLSERRPSTNEATIQLYRSPGFPYESFIRIFGRANYHQKYTQTSQVTECNVQTEVVLMKDKSVQHPSYNRANDYRSIYSKPIDAFALLDFLNKSHRILKVLLPNWCQDTAESTKDPRLGLSSGSSSGRSSVNSMFSSSQWQSSGNKFGKRYLKIPAGSEKFCSSFYKLLPGAVFLKGLPISLVSTRGQYLITVQISTAKNESYLSVWPIKGTTRPEAILKVRSIVNCTVASDCDETVFAGTVDGSIHMWSLSTFHSSYSNNLTSATSSASMMDGESGGSGGNLLRTPSFSTFCVSNLSVHHDSIVSLDILQGNTRKSYSSVRPYRICSVDENATVALWIVEYSNKLSISYSEVTGDGMAPGSLSKLVLESTFTMKHVLNLGDNFSSYFFDTDEQVNKDEVTKEKHHQWTSTTRRPSKDRKLSGIPEKEYITAMSCSPFNGATDAHVNVTSTPMSTDGTRSTLNTRQASIFLATSSGIVHQVLPFNETPILSYTCLLPDELPFTSVVSININCSSQLVNVDAQVTGNDSHLNSHLILVAFADGTLALFRQNYPLPIVTWDASDSQINSITTVQWLPSCPSAFVVLDELDSLLFWDLTVTLYNPLFKYQLSK